MKNTLYQRIESYSAQHNLIPSCSTIVIGLSGGPDSVFLLHFLKTLQENHSLTLIAAHLDHGWRPDSAHDAQFCSTIAQSHNILFISKKLSDLPITFKSNGSQEEIGRNARRYFFEMLKKEYNADFIALAHHAQDQQETFFIRLLRGASLSGLVGMKPKDGCYIRPLLASNKQDILDYLHTHNIVYLTDPSNTSDIYLRNRIRIAVIPALSQCDSRFNENFANTLSRLKDTEDFLIELTHKTFKEISVINKHLCINAATLSTQHPIMQYRLIMHWLVTQKLPFPPSQSFFDEMLRFIASSSTKEHLIHPAWKMVKHKNFIWIETRCPE